MSSEEDDPSTPPKKAKIVPNKTQHRKQKFRSEWCKLDEFREWLLPDNTDQYRAKCRFCTTATMVAEISNLRAHAKGGKHLSLARSATERQSLIKQFAKNQSTAPSKLVSTAEIKIAGFVAEHNIPFLATDHLILLLKDIFKDSPTAQEMTLGRHKATAVVKNVIGATQKEDLASKLRKSKFSILTDESTDIGCVKISCVVVRYFDEDSERVESKFWELCKVFDGTNDTGTIAASGENLFNGLMRSFEPQKIPVRNIIGFGADGCSVMMGPHNSVSSRLRELCPGIVIVKCVCHSAHLCASEACKQLPRFVEDLARNIYSYFKLSAKRQAEFRQFQAFLDLEPHKLLHPSQTRWLSLVAVVQRILEQWDALKLFFTDQVLVARLGAAEMIYKGLDDPFCKLYFLFLEWILPKFTEFNQYFQSKKVVVVDMHEKVRELYQEILLCFMKRSYVMGRDLSAVNPADSTQHLQDNMYLGVKVKNLADSPAVMSNPTARQEFFRRCRLFLMTGALQIRQRYNMDDPVSARLTYLKPKNALSLGFRDKVPSIEPLASVVPRALDESVEKDALLQRLDDQWRRLPLALPRLPEGLENELPDKMWAKIRKECPEFEDLCKFALSVLSLPHSNSDCERVFSKVNLTKTDTRNRLETETINGTILASELVRGADGDGCPAFQPSEAMLQRMTARNLYGSAPQEDTQK